MRGLDPRIHLLAKTTMDCRGKPGNAGTDQPSYSLSSR
jgi:hypothetical protein